MRSGDYEHYFERTTDHMNCIEGAGVQPTLEIPHPDNSMEPCGEGPHAGAQTSLWEAEGVVGVPVVSSSDGMDKRTNDSAVVAAVVVRVKGAAADQDKVVTRREGRSVEQEGFSSPEVYHIPSSSWESRAKGYSPLVFSAFAFWQLWTPPQPGEVSMITVPAHEPRGGNNCIHSVGTPRLPRAFVNRNGMSQAKACARLEAEAESTLSISLRLR